MRIVSKQERTENMKLQHLQLVEPSKQMKPDVPRTCAVSDSPCSSGLRFVMQLGLLLGLLRMVLGDLTAKRLRVSVWDSKFGLSLV